MDVFFCSDSEIQRASLSDAQENDRNFKPDTQEEFLQDIYCLAAEVGGSACSGRQVKYTGEKKIIEVPMERNTVKNDYFPSKLENRCILVEQWSFSILSSFSTKITWESKMSNS